MSFDRLSLHPHLLQAIKDAGYEAPTPIQVEAIPHVLEGRDLKASAQTGTGKTAAFILPALHRLIAEKKMGKGPRILVLVPTRELASQVAKEAMKYSQHAPFIKTVCIFGGTPYPEQNKQLSRPYDLLIATPGRLMDHLERGRIPLNRLELFILDEADRMLDMGFIEPVEEIARQIPNPHQTLLFSATLKGNVSKLAGRLLTNPVEVCIESKQGAIEQKLFMTDHIEHKYRLLDRLLEDRELKQTIIFTATKHQADVLADKLAEEGHSAAALHGDLNQRQRNRTILQLRKGTVNILVATDVAARGIDIPSLSHVINFDLPRSAEDYVHRIGRTGRAGATGIAISFSSHKEGGLVRNIEGFTGQKMVPSVLEGLEPQARAEKRSFRPKESFRNNRKPFSHNKRSFSSFRSKN